MDSSLLSCENDIQAMHDLIGRLSSKTTIVGFDEQISLSKVKAGDSIAIRINVKCPK